MPPLVRQRMQRSTSRLRLQTLVRLRWFAVVGQLAAIAAVYWGLGFDLPVGLCLAFIALSAWLNVFLRIRYPARHRLDASMATALLAYDILQLAALLYLTGGIENPFAFLIVAPVTVSAATLPPRHTVVLGLFAMAMTALLVRHHRPLPWRLGEAFSLPITYKMGLLAAVAAGLIFLALYAFRLSKEARQMTAALQATEHILAREQKLHALDGLAAAAAHELGTPLNTITLVTSELAREVPADSPIADDIALLRSEAQRCRAILQKLTRAPSERDPMHARLTVTQLIDEAAEPYRGKRVEIHVRAQPGEGASEAGAREPEGERRPGVIYGIGNIIENASDFARSRIDVEARWDEKEVVVIVSDDGPGFPPDIMDTLGEPYVTTRPAGRKGTEQVGRQGLGLGFFIAKTLLERSGAELELDNRADSNGRDGGHGAIVRIAWQRDVFDQGRGEAGTEEDGYGVISAGGG